MNFLDYLAHFGWSQAQFARRIGVTPETVSRWGGEAPTSVMLYLGELHQRELDIKAHRQLLDDMEARS